MLIVPTPRPRQQDGPFYDGSVQKQVLLAFNEARTVMEVATALNWDRERTHRWVKHLRNTGKLFVQRWIVTKNNRKAAVYSTQRAETT